MPYSRKRRYPYKSRYRRSGYRAKRYRGLTPTYRGFAGPQQLKAEWKYCDIVPTPFQVSQTGSDPVLLSAVPQGNGATDRIGMRISIRSIEIRGLILQGISNIIGALRFCIVQDRQTNGEQAPWSTIFTGAGINALRNLGQRKRFKILRDKTYTCQFHDSGNNVTSFHWYIKLNRPITVEYNGGTTTAMSAIATNSISLYFISTYAQKNDTAPSIGIYSRLRYTDV